MAVDAVHIIETGKIDWERFVESTKLGGYEAEIYVAFRYLIERKLVPVPDSFWNALENIPLKRSAINQYYRRWDLGRILLGNFPSYWYRYWKYDSEGSFFRRCYGLPAYLRNLWGLDQKKSLFLFLFEKYRMRLLGDKTASGKP